MKKRIISVGIIIGLLLHTMIPVYAADSGTSISDTEMQQESTLVENETETAEESSSVVQDNSFTAVSELGLDESVTDSIVEFETPAENSEVKEQTIEEKTALEKPADHEETNAHEETTSISYDGENEEVFDVESEEEILLTESQPSVSYRTHVQSVGWQGWKENGTLSGTSGQSKRLEAIEIKVSGMENLGIQYKTHIQKIGWESGWKTNGQTSGTSGQSKRLEAIQIRLTGSAASQYDIWYCVHAQHFGWLNWAQNGEEAGTSGYAYRLEGIKIRILPKGSKAPVKEGTVTSAFYSKTNGPGFDKSQTGVAYNTHVQTYGWQDYVYNGSMAGTSGQSKRLEGIHISLVNQKYSGNIEYRTHIQKIGWQGWKQNGDMSGTSGQAKRLEAIEIRLTGEMANHYDIYYRVHAQRCGWMSWAKNGERAGTAGYAFRLEGIQIVLVDKWSGTPSTSLMGYKQTTDMPFTDRNTNSSGFDIDTRYGGPDIIHAECYYSGSTLVIDTTLYNNRIFQADYYDWITITVYDVYGQQFATKTFNNIPLHMAPYATMPMRFTIENAPIKNINAANGGGIQLYYNYYYTYTI